VCARVEAVVGDAALSYLQDLEACLGDAASELKSSGHELVERIKSLVLASRDLDRQVQELRKQVALAGTARSNQPHEEEIAGMPCFIAIYDGIPAKELRGLVDEEKKRIAEGIIVVMSRDDGKVAVAAGVTGKFQDRVSAVDLVREAATALGGKGGGGRPDMAQAGGPDVNAAEDAAARLRGMIAAK
jgi:Alanyl-tRNA synthetase